MTADKRSRGFVSHAATYAIGNIARRIVGFAMLPIYTRFLTPADYGVVGLLTFALAIFETLLGARLGAAIPKFYSDAKDSLGRRAALWGALGVSAAASAVAVGVVVLLRGVGSELLFGDRRYALVLAFFSVNLVSQPIEQTGMTYLRLRERSGLFLAFSMSKLVLQVALNLLLVVYWREGVMGVVVSGIISSIVLGLATTAYLAAHEAPAFDWHTTRRMVQFCWPLWLSGLAGLYIGSSGSMYLRVFGTLSDVGLLSLGLRFATVVGMLIWSPFFAHWEPMSFQYYKDADGRRKFHIAFVVSSALMFAGGLGVSLFAGPVIRVMAAKSFDAAAAVVPILTLGFVLNSLRQFFSFSLYVTGNTKLYSVIQYGTAFLITVAYLLLIPRFGLLGAAAAQTLAFAANFIYLRVVSRRYFDSGIKLMPLALFSLIGVVAFVCSNVIVRVPDLALDLLIKSLVLLMATALIGFVGLRSIVSVEGTVESLPWPLHRLGRIPLGRRSGR